MAKIEVFGEAGSGGDGSGKWEVGSSKLEAGSMKWEELTYQVFFKPVRFA